MNETILVSTPYLPFFLYRVCNFSYRKVSPQLKTQVWPRTVMWKS